ncbi:hypothetical protein C8A03DRAFT_13156 [Achaetomium macrosporum]|uniref:Ergosterol biosynthetic protein 28 n=1 Tax=Achaetomium macrosporum TaxID=79813 RepID=A0AAN7CED4_9PEZI|nr:hypothetical protein C8A03DRAFT_13156 [Achaetomium macrosporum]
MDKFKAFLPSGEKGYLPYYLFVVSVVAMGNAFQTYITLHYTRRIYNGRFVPNHSLPPATERYNPEDSTGIVKPASSTGKDSEKAKDQVSPLASRLFGAYTFMAGLIRFYACYQLENPAMYQLAIWTHVVAAVHFTSEMLAFKTIRFSGPQIFPFMAAYGGTIWMLLQYKHYVH